ncbi:hypothetical protein J7J84_06895 [bacterium]|nr:hypothetical protein [bacterium]
MASLSDIRAFYRLLADLKGRICGLRTLATCDGKTSWPQRGVYFFFEEGEIRRESGSGLRVVRVGTHALKTGSKTTLWKRLKNHKGAKNGGGNHRGSIFRLLIGAALMKRDKRLRVESWGQGNSAPKEVQEREKLLEMEVSEYIGAMPFLWLKVDDEPSPVSLRGIIERSSIALLSNYGKSQAKAIDQPSGGWLGRSSDREKACKSGLWNSNHVDGKYDPLFLSKLAKLVSQI